VDALLSEDANTWRLTEFRGASGKRYATVQLSTDLVDNFVEKPSPA
jgi:hypothetical protein